jgi:hypothetical protein
MGQKINPVGFRLGNRRAWNFVWATDSINYSKTLLTNFEICQRFSWTFDRLGLFPNNLILKKSAKQYQIFGRLANVSKFAPVWKTSTPSLFEDHLRRKRFAQNFSHTLSGISLDLFTFQNSKIQQLFQRLVLSSAKRFIKEPLTEGLKNEEILSLTSFLLDPAFDEGKLLRAKSGSYESIPSLLGNTASKVLYPSISAQVLSSYIKKQMSAPQKLKDLDFRINLKTGISMLALFLLKRFPLGSSIRGLRIVCSGRWTKTRSGRKQRLVYNRGSLKRLTFSALLDYGMTTVTTKFGVCSIKVWILYEPTNTLPLFIDKQSKKF